jgi:hypothetical protein
VYSVHGSLNSLFIFYLCIYLFNDTLHLQSSSSVDEKCQYHYNCCVDKIQEEVVRAYFKILFHILPVGNEENHKNYAQYPGI